MTIKFSSREIHFLKSGSEDALYHPPETFFSDLLFDKTDRMDNFENRLDHTDIPGDIFLCAVLRMMPGLSEDLLNKAQDTFEATFNLFLDNERGIWEALDETAFALAFWDYDSEDKARDLLISLKEKLAGSLGTDILAGLCFFPFHTFSKTDTFANALKAIDHAAFFGSNTLYEFDATSLNISADRLYQLSRYEAAVTEYEKGLEIEPKNANLMNSLGVCFGITGELDKAEALFKSALSVTPGDALVIYNIGLLQHINGLPDKAMIYLRKAHGVDPDVFEVELLMGQILFKQGQPDQALPHLEKAAVLNPESGLAFRLMGELHLAENRPEAAGQQFNTAIKRNPSDAVSLSGYAESLVQQDKNLSIALSFANNSVALDPDNALFRKRLEVIREKIDAVFPDSNSIKTA